MPAKLSKEVTDRMKICRFFLTALWLQGPRVAERLLELVRPHLLEGDEKPDFFAAIAALARHLEASLERLVADDGRLYAANAHLDRLRALRDELFSRLARKMARVRLTLVNQYVAPQLIVLGLGRETARTPIALVRQSGQVELAFQGADLAQLLGEQVFAEPIDLRSQVAELPPIAKELRQTLKRVDEAQREVDQAKVDKDEDMEAHDVAYFQEGDRDRALEDAGKALLRLGERKKASERFDRLFEAFLGSAPEKHTLAVMIDRSLLLARRACDVDIRAILGMFRRCKRLDLDPKTKKRLREVKRIVSQQPEKAASAFAALRSSFIVPVPGLLAEAGKLR